MRLRHRLDGLVCLVRLVSLVCSGAFTAAAWAQAHATPATSHRLTEVSGLAWDAETQVLFAVSDRGLLYRLALDHPGGQPPAAPRLLSARRLGASGRGRLDAEGLSLVPARHSPSGQTELLVATEGPARVLRYNTDGDWLGEWPLPAALAGSRALRRGNSQLEAVATHPQLGLLVAAEAPTTAGPLARHEVHSASRSWTFATGGGRQVRLKAMDVLQDGRLLVPERAQAGPGGGPVNRLLEVDLAACGGSIPCPVRVRRVLDSETDADNHEGMTVLGEGHGGLQVLLVSDDRGQRDRGTRFQWLSLP